MANSFLIPPNLDPASTAQTAASYTVPSGKFAIVTVTLNAYAGPDAEANISAGAAGISYGGESDSNSTSFQLYLAAGQSLTKSETVASASASSTTSANSETVTAVSTSTASISIDGTVVATVAARGMSSYSGTGDAVIRTVNVSGGATAQWHAAEYNSIV